MSVSLNIKSTPILTLNPSGKTPLAALLEVETSAPSTITATLDNGERKRVQESGGAPTTHHRIPILGLRPDRQHQIYVRATDVSGDSDEISEPLAVTTAPLPDDFPALNVTVSNPAKMEPGYTVFPARLSEREDLAKKFGMLIALDEAGEVVWFYKADHQIGSPHKIANGNIVYNTRARTTYEIDLLGNVISTWHATGRWPADGEGIAVGAESFHHDLVELPNGNILVPSIEVREIPDYPTSYTDPDAPTDTANVIGDVIVEFRRDGTIANQWPLLDMLDPYRFGFGSLDPRGTLGDLENVRNWSHCNSNFYCEEDDSIILSVRHQDAIVKFSRSSGELIWILGDPDGWKSPWREKLLTPIGDVIWQFHQHNATRTPAGTIMCFDNGNYRARPFADPLPTTENYSRAVEFEVDEEAMTVRQVWDYGRTQAEKFYATFVSGAVMLPETRNVFVDFGGLMVDGDNLPTERPHVDCGYVRMAEVTHDDEPEVVFEFFMDDRPGKGWDSYRGQRISNFFD